MKKTLTIAFCACAFLMSFGQEQNTTEIRMKNYSARIEEIIQQEKKNIKKELNAVDKDFENKLISQQEKIEKREEIASKYEKIINEKVDAEKVAFEEYTKEKVKNSVLGKTNKYNMLLSTFWDGDTWLYVDYRNSNLKKDLLKNRFSYNMSVGYVNLLDKSGSLNMFESNDKINNAKTCAMYYSFGFSNQLGSLRSPIFYRIGLDYKATYIYPEKPLVWEQNKDNLYLTEFQRGTLKRNELRNHYFIVPLDFKFILNPKYTTENGEEMLDYSKPKFQIGVGVYGGARFLTQSYRIYKNEDDIKVKYRENINDKMNPFVFGAKFSIGYRGFNVYTKKDFTPMFKGNTALDNKYAMEIGIDYISFVF